MVQIRSIIVTKLKLASVKIGPSWDSNPGPLAPEARIIPLDHLAWPCKTASQLAAPTDTTHYKDVRDIHIETN